MKMKIIRACACLGVLALAVVAVFIMLPPSAEPVFLPELPVNPLYMGLPDEPEPPEPEPPEQKPYFHEKNAGVSSYTIKLSKAVVIYAGVHTLDIIPPTAELREVTMEMGREIEPDDIIVSMFGRSEIVSVIINQPDIFEPGEHIVYVYLRDAFDNEAVYTTTVTLLPNTTPPTIRGTRDIFAPEGGPIRFREGVTAYDAFGRSIPFTIDNAGVNIYASGVYTVAFIAEDAWGLRTVRRVYVHILGIQPAQVRENIAVLLRRIVNSNHSQTEQARAIHNWLGNNITFAAAVSTNTVYAAANHGMLHRRGNCLVFYAMAKLMLTEAGIPNISMARTPHTCNPAGHRWHLINPDGLGWFHFDATPVTAITRAERFMFTQSQAEAFTLRRYYTDGITDFYTFFPPPPVVIVP